jgi:hypothetical protein
MTVRLAVVLSSVLVIGLGTVPTAALAQRLDGRAGERGMHVGRPGHVRSGAQTTLSLQRPGFGASQPGHHPFGNRRFHRHPHFGSAVYPYWTTVYVGPTPSYDPSPVYNPPVYYYDPGRPYGVPSSVSVSAPPAPPPPTPTVIQHATGRYELRGDGLSTPYTWVWIPNPPPAPPASSPAEGSTGAPRPGPTRLYTWTDREGVIHYTDQAENVPAEYRAETKQKRL